MKLISQNQEHVMPRRKKHKLGRAKYQPSEFVLSQKSAGMAQHFMIIHQIRALDGVNGQEEGPSYFAVTHEAGRVIVPVVNAVVTVPLPSKMRFEHVRNGKVRSKSSFMESEELQERVNTIPMIRGEDNGYDLEVSLVWGTNLWRHRPENNMLLDSVELMIYEIEFRFENKVEQSGQRLKLMAGNRAFQLNSAMQEIKVSRFARIVYFIAKSEEEEFSFILEKGNRPIARAVVFTEEIVSFRLNQMKKKLLDNQGKPIAHVRFKCEKAKNLSLPHNNLFWKEKVSNGRQGVVLEFSQITRVGGPSGLCGLVIKTEEEEIYVPALTDFSVFELESEIPEPVQLPMHNQGSIYLKLVPEQEEQNKHEEDYVGIAVVNYKQLRLGINVLTLSFFKQQKQTCECNILVNKAVYWPFVKPIPQQQVSLGGFKSMIISIILHRVLLTSYFETFQYDRKSDMYCIVEVNRIKKVIILERVRNQSRAIVLVNAAQSDQLNFNVECTDSARIKVTLLVSDGGVEQEIYGTLQRRVKLMQLGKESATFRKQGIANDHGVLVGEVEFEVQKGKVTQQRVPVKKELNAVKMDIAKVNNNLAMAERKMSIKKINAKVSPRVGRKRYDSLVLPEIMNPAQQKARYLAKMMEEKKRNRSQRRSEPLQLIKKHQTSLNRSKKTEVPSQPRVKTQGLRMPPLQPQSQLESHRQPLPLPYQVQQMREEREQSEIYQNTRRSRPSRRSRINITLDAPEISQNNQFAQIDATNSRMYPPLQEQEQPQQ